jgi:pyruvate formate lyase activating enzyme
MTSGIVFDIREFTVHDGPGIRTTVFLKGCALHCTWCHNPEGISPQPQMIHSRAGDRIAGKVYTPDELAALLNGQAAILAANEGGITFSGGEPALQADFLLEVITRLRGVHVLLDTAGYAPEAGFARLAASVQLVYFDLKLIDPLAHRRYTGQANDLILRNLQRLSTLGAPFVIRVPLIPGVTDTEANLSAIACTVAGLPGLVNVDLLPYNRAAGGKYAAAGMTFSPGYDESRPVNANSAPFEALGVPVVVR